MTNSKITTITQLKSSLVQSKIYVLNQITNVIEAVDVELSEIRSLINGKTSSLPLEGGKIMLAELSPHNIEGAFWYDHYEEYNDPTKIPCLKLRHKDYDYIYKYDQYIENTEENLTSNASSETVSILGTEAGYENGSFWYELDSDDQPILYFYKDGYSYGIKHDYADYKGIADKTHLIFYAPYDVDLQDAYEANLTCDVPTMITSSFAVKGKSLYMDAGTITYDLSETLGENDFTISYYFYLHSGSNTYLNFVSNIQSFDIQNNGHSVVFDYYNCDTRTTPTIQVNYCDSQTNDYFWHVAVVYEYKNRKLMLFVNGKLLSTSNNIEIMQTPRQLKLTGIGRKFFIDEFKIYNGIAIWKSDFIPPIQHYSSEYPNALSYASPMYFNSAIRIFGSMINPWNNCNLTKDVLFKNCYSIIIKNEDNSNYKGLIFNSNKSLTLVESKFTLECFLYVAKDQLGSPVFCIGSKETYLSNYPILILTSEGLTIYATGHSNDNPKHVINDQNHINLVPYYNEWFHAAFVKDADKFYYFCNGRLVKYWNNYTGTDYNSSHNRSLHISSYELGLYLGGARFWEDKALYTSDFIPPTDF